MSVSIDDIKTYWKQSELEQLADYNEDERLDDEVIQTAITDAVNMLNPIKDIIDSSLFDTYTKKLTICELIARVNISPDAVELPIGECKRINEFIDKVMLQKAKIPSGGGSVTASTSEGINVKPRSHTIEFLEGF